MIRTTYDSDADAMFIRFAADGVLSVRTEDASPGVMLDYDKDDALTAIEVLDLRERGARRAAAA